MQFISVVRYAFSIVNRYILTDPLICVLWAVGDAALRAQEWRWSGVTDEPKLRRGETESEVPA